jgi:hypothetical protein
MSQHEQSRQPSGAPQSEGGRFAGQARPETSTALTALATDHDVLRSRLTEAVRHSATGALNDDTVEAVTDAVLAAFRDDLSARVGAMVRHRGGSGGVFERSPKGTPTERWGYANAVAYSGAVHEVLELLQPTYDPAPATDYPPADPLRAAKTFVDTCRPAEVVAAQSMLRMSRNLRRDVMVDRAAGSFDAARREQARTMLHALVDAHDGTTSLAGYLGNVLRVASMTGPAAPTP